ncbi:MAG: MotA/TolQ/ExbB proton channel family protein [Massilibacteroides sp.]|nr:MotA/TolQ/ExbB proton channel family protein [Massilibacteroides sp.]
MNQITNILYWLTTGLQIPVILFLLLFFLQSLFLIGGFYGLYLSRNKVNVKLHRQLDDTTVREVLETLSTYKEKQTLIIDYLLRVKRYHKNPLMLDKIVGDYEIQSDKELSKSKLLVKIGPMLGLMGTLIPMGPALVGLATGDVSSMATNMQVAFSTTVVGIVIGAVGFITLQVKQRWLADDMNILEFIVESIKEDKDETQA